MVYFLIKGIRKVIKDRKQKKEDAEKDAIGKDAIGKDAIGKDANGKEDAIVADVEVTK
jgi:hypothetical protein